jgi:adenylate cyclase
MTGPMQRRLTAILAADVAGYSGLMEADEAGTLERLKINRGEIFDPSVAAHGGRLVKLMGDGALVEFGSVVAAVNCALEIQAAVADAEQESPEARGIRYRIGVNLGEVIVEGDDIYGEGVNVAARLQALAPVGGIAISRVVHDQVAGKVSCAFDDAGEHRMKNIQRPVHVYTVRPANAVAPALRGPKLTRRWVMGAIASAALLIGVAVAWTMVHRAGTSTTVAAAAESGPLSIVVLPFANLTGDAGQDYFADGLTASVTADLSRIEGAFVVDSASAQSYKGKGLTAQQIGRALGVRFVLQGSVQRSSNHVRINAQLADATSNSQLWSDNFEGDTRDLFALQDQITGRIADSMQHEMVVVAARESEKRQGDPRAVDLMLRARALSDKPQSLANWQQVELLSRQALEIEPGNVKVMMLLATALSFEASNFGAELADGVRDRTWSEAMVLATKVNAVDPDNPDYFRVAAFHARYVGDIYGERRAAESMLRLNPRDPSSYNVLAGTYLRAGEPKRAIELLTTAVGMQRKNADSVFGTQPGPRLFHGRQQQGGHRMVRQGAAEQREARIGASLPGRGLCRRRG